MQIRSLIGISLMIIVLLMAYMYAQQRNNLELTFQDRAEIRELLWTNHTGFDFANRDAASLWSSTFTPDAVLQNGNTVKTGEQEIRQYARDYFKNDPQRKIRHWTSTFHITPTAEGAMLSAFWYTMTQEGDKKGLTLGSAGRYESHVIKTTNGWRIKKHHVFHDGPIMEHLR